MRNGRAIAPTLTTPAHSSQHRNVTFLGPTLSRIRLAQGLVGIVEREAAYGRAVGYARLLPHPVVTVSNPRCGPVAVPHRRQPPRVVIHVRRGDAPRPVPRLQSYEAETNSTLITRHLSPIRCSR